MSLSFCRVSVTVALLRRALLGLAAFLIPTLAFAQNGTVTGTVTNSATAAPVGNAFVSFCTEFGAGGVSCFSAATSASGAYSRILAPGTYYAYTSNTGLINEIYDNMQCPASACQAFAALISGTPIVVTSGATVSGRDFALDPGGSVSGVVTDAATGAPIQGVFVQIVTRLVGGSTVFVASNQTNASGAYTVSGLPTGTYYASTSNSLGYTNEIYDNVLCAGGCGTTLTAQSGTDIAVVAGQVSAGRNFALDVGGTITGTIMNAATSTPAQNVSVNVYTRVGDFLSQVASGFTNASGVYTVRGLPTATYYVATSASTNLNLINEIYNNIPCAGFCSLTLPNPGTPVQVTLGVTTAGIDFQLDMGGSIAGTITDSGTSLPLANVSISVYRQVGTNASFVSSGFTNSSGMYTASGLPSGSYFALASSQTHVDEIYDNMPCTASCLSSELLSGTPIAVTAGSTTSGRDFALDPGGGISGMVTNASTSAPLSNVSISVYTRVGTTSVFVGSTSPSATTGAWSMSGLAPGTYYAFTSTGSSTRARFTNEIYNNIPCPTGCSSTTATATGTPITVTALATTTGIDFALSPSTSVPSSPGSFGASVSNFVARFSWTVPSFGAYPTSYVIEAGLTSGSTLITFTTTNTFLDIPGVPPGRFYLRVRAVNAFGTGSASVEYVLVVNADGSGVLGAPQSMAGRMNGGRLTLTWSDPIFGGVPTSYVVEVGTGAGLSNLVSLPVASRSFTFEPVPTGVYFIRIRSRVGAQLSPPSGEVMIVVGGVPSPPEAPRNLFHTLTGSTVTLTWLAPYFGSPTSYVIEAGTASGLSDIVVFNTGSAGLSLSFSGVPPGTYYVRVRAVNALGMSVASNERVIVVS